MTNNGQTNYLKIGSFVIAGIALIILIILFLGAKTWFQKTIYVETYFDESVQGLDEGSPVKYLGIEVGHIKRMAPIDTIYKINRHDPSGMRERYIYVLMAINPKFFKNAVGNNIQTIIDQDVAIGLRVQLALQNVTGTSYLELDFLDPQKHPSLPIYWLPKHPYIPSTPSTLTYIRREALLLIEDLRQINFKKLFGNIQEFSDSANDVTNKVDNLLTKTNRQIAGTIDNLHNISQSLNALTEQTKDFPSYTLFGKPPPTLNPGKL